MLKMYRRGLTAVVAAGVSLAAGVITSCGTEQEATVAAEQPVSAALADACNLEGTWGVKFVIPVKWGANMAIQGGAGEIVQWALTERKHDGGNAVLDALRPCGSTVPDYKSQALFGGQTFGVRFPNALFD